MLPADDLGQLFLWFPKQSRDEARDAAGLTPEDKSFAVRIVGVKAPAWMPAAQFGTDSAQGANGS